MYVLPQPGNDFESLFIVGLNRLKRERVNGVVKVSSTYDFAVVVDARCYQQRPAGIGRDELVQIGHLAVLPEERPQVVVNRCIADHLAQVIDVECRARRVLITQRAQILDRTISPDHSVLRAAIVQVAGSNDRTLIVDGLSTAECAAWQVWQLLHLARMP